MRARWRAWYLRWIDGDDGLVTPADRRRTLEAARERQDAGMAQYEMRDPMRKRYS